MYIVLMPLSLHSNGTARRILLNTKGGRHVVKKRVRGRASLHDSLKDEHCSDNAEMSRIFPFPPLFFLYFFISLFPFFSFSLSFSLFSPSLPLSLC